MIYVEMLENLSFIITDVLPIGAPWGGSEVLSFLSALTSFILYEWQREERLAALIGHGGIQECGNAQNCVRVCPKEIPLTDAIAALNMDCNLFAIKRFFKR